MLQSGLGSGRSAQRDAVIGLQFDQDLAENADALRLRLAVGVEGRRGRVCAVAVFGGGFFGACRALQAAFERLQQLAGILKVAAPQQTRAFTGQAVGGVGVQGVIHHHQLGWRASPMVSHPKRAARMAIFLPSEGSRWGHEKSRPSDRCAVEVAS